MIFSKYLKMAIPLHITTRGAENLLRYCLHRKQSFRKVPSQPELGDGEKQVIPFNLSTSRSEARMLRNQIDGSSASELTASVSVVPEGSTKKSPPGRGCSASCFSRMLSRGGFWETKGQQSYILNRQNSPLLAWQIMNRAVFLTTVILLTIFIKASFAQSPKAIPLTPSPEGIHSGKGKINAFPSDTTYIQLQKYLQIAAEQSPKLKAEFYRYRAVLAQAPQAGALPDPKVMLNYFATPRHYSSPFSRTMVTLSQHFPWFGTLKAAENKVEELAKAKLASFINARNKLFKNVKNVWFRMYEMKHHIRILGEHLDLLQKLESRALTLYKTSRTSQTDVLRLQMEVDRVHTRLKQKKEKLEKFQVQFNELLNRNPQANIHTPMPMPHHTLKFTSRKIVQKVEAENPKITKLHFRKQAAHYSLKKARRDGLPSFSIGVAAMLPNYMYMTMMPGKRTAFVAKLSVSIPIFRSKYKAQKREAKLTIQSINQQHYYLINQLTSTLAKRLQEYRDAQYRINLYENNLIPKTKQALNISVENYSTGKGNFEELFQLQEQILKYKMKLHTAYVERNIAVADIEYLYGKYNVNPEEF